MRRYIQMIVTCVFLLGPACADALQKMDDSQLKDVHAQSGLSIAVSNVPIYYNYDSIRFSAVNNMDMFGNLTGDEGYLSLNNFQGLLGFDSEIHLDIGTYQAPDEHYVAADCAIAYNSLDRQYVEHRLVGGLGLQDEPFYYPINDDVTRPLEGNSAVIHAEISDLTSIFDTFASVDFCDMEDITNFRITGVTMPEFTLDDVRLPGSVLTLYPESGCGINFELRTRLTVERVKLYSTGSEAQPDVQIQGIHLAEAFAYELPSHLEDTGNIQGGGIDTTGWGEGDDLVSQMYSGYFLLGNLNQVDFEDQINDRQLYDSDGIIWGDDIETSNEDDYQLVGLVANPTSINVASVDDRQFISIKTGIHGSIRIESVAGNDGTEMGPMAIDGIRIKHCEIEFPGGHTRVDANGVESYKGRLHPDQLQWLNNLP